VSAPGAGLGAGRTSGPWLPEMPALALGVRRDTGVSAIMGTKPASNWCCYAASCCQLLQLQQPSNVIGRACDTCLGVIVSTPTAVVDAAPLVHLRALVSFAEIALSNHAHFANDASGVVHFLSRHCCYRGSCEAVKPSIRAATLFCNGSCSCTDAVSAAVAAAPSALLPSCLPCASTCARSFPLRLDLQPMIRLWLRQQGWQQQKMFLLLPLLLQLHAEWSGSWATG